MVAYLQQRFHQFTGIRRFTDIWLSLNVDIYKKEHSSITLSVSQIEKTKKENRISVKYLLHDNFLFLRIGDAKKIIADASRKDDNLQKVVRSIQQIQELELKLKAQLEMVKHTKASLLKLLL